MMILKKTLYTCFLVLTFNQLFAQKDTTSNLSSIDSIDAAYESKIKKLESYQNGKEYTFQNQTLINEKTLFKFGVNLHASIPSTDGYDYPLLSGVFGIEKKISHAFSFGIYGNYYPGRNFRTEIININPEIKYYYRKRRSINKESQANNFHGNYILFRVENLIKWENNHYQALSNTLTFQPSPYLNIGWGLQRRIGNSAYFDFNIFLRYNLDSYYLGVKLSFGIGWGLNK